MPTRLTSVAQIDFTPRSEPFPSPTDWRDQFIYQLLIDRFDDNNPNTPPFDPEKSKRGREKDAGNRFVGGKIKGITRRLDYIKGLGCTAIWISPPFKNRQDDPCSYHGYGIQDFLAVDPRFGTLEDLQELVREAHQRGMHVIFDVVINHSADIFRYTEDDTPYRSDKQYDFKEWHKISDSNELGPDDAIWPIELQTPDAFKRRGHIRNLLAPEPDEMVDGDFFGYKELNVADPRIMDTLIACYKYWIAATDVDGFRIDTVGNVEPRFCAAFCNAIEEFAKSIGKNNFFIFGEIVGSDDVLHKYIGNNSPGNGTSEPHPHLDAVLDFPLYGVLDEVIKGEHDPRDLAKRYDFLRQYYRDFAHAGNYYVTFIDNHDQVHRPGRRFLTGVNDPRVGVLGIGFLLCNLGIPCIYYGTEQGFDGSGDGDYFIREAMFGGKWGAFDSVGVHFFNRDHPIYKGIARIAKIRADEKTLRFGREFFREISGNGQDFGLPESGKATLALSRVLDTEEIIIAMNLDTEQRDDCVLVDATLTSMKVALRDLISGEWYSVEKNDAGVHFVRVPLAPRQMVILKQKS